MDQKCSKDFYYVTNISISNKCSSFELSSRQRIMKELSQFSQKYQVAELFSKKCFSSTSSWKSFAITRINNILRIQLS